MKKIFPQTIKTVATAFALFAFVATPALATWTAPSNPPTGGDVSAPINTSSFNQTKAGGITANWFIGHNGLFNAGISCAGTNCPSGSQVDILEALDTVASKIKGIKIDDAGNLSILDGNQGAGKVLTSDTNGVATWQTPAGGGSTLPTGTVNQTFRNDGTKWNPDSYVLNYDDNSSDNGLTQVIHGDGAALTLLGNSQTFMQWLPQSALGFNANPSTWVGARATAGFGSSGSKMFKITNEFSGNGTPTNTSGAIAINPGSQAAVGINTTAPDPSDGVVLDVNGRLKIYDDGDAQSGKVLTSIDSSGRAAWGTLQATTSSSPFNLDVVQVSEGKVISSSGAYGSAINGGGNSSIAVCPSGYIAVSGGGSCTDSAVLGDLEPGYVSNGNYTTASTATNENPNAWKSSCNSNNGTNTAYVVCMEPTPVVTGVSVTPPSTQSTSGLSIKGTVETVGSATGYCTVTVSPGKSCPLTDIEYAKLVTVSVTGGSGGYTYTLSPSTGTYATGVEVTNDSSVSTARPNIYITWIGNGNAVQVPVTITVTDSNGDSASYTTTVSS